MVLEGDYQNTLLDMIINFGLQVILSGDIFHLPPIGNELYGDREIFLPG